MQSSRLTLCLPNVICHLPCYLQEKRKKWLCMWTRRMMTAESLSLDSLSRQSSWMHIEILTWGTAWKWQRQVILQSVILTLRMELPSPGWRYNTITIQITLFIPLVAICLEQLVHKTQSQTNKYHNIQHNRNI